MSDAHLANANSNAPVQEFEPALPFRSHTILGVCEAIGEDFGFNPTWLRIPLAAMVLFSPMAAIGGYFALGAVVLLSRLVFPAPRSPGVRHDAAETAPLRAPETRDEQPELPLAA